MKPALIETAGKPNGKRDVDLELRSHQVDYLRYVADREDMSVSRALACIIETYAGRADGLKRAPTKKARAHLIIEDAHIAVLDGLALKWGVFRSDVVQRLVDGAHEEDPWIGRPRCGQIPHRA